MAAFRPVSMEHRRTSPVSGRLGWSPVLELRQYQLHPGRRDTLIELFEHRLIEPQEEVGMKVIGQFIDLDDPDRFVWLRGYESMESRREGLAAFYGGPVWKANRDAANATMIDSDNVLLLRPARADAAFDLPDERAAPGIDGERDRGVVCATILYLDDQEFETVAAELLERTLAPAITDLGGTVLASFCTEPAKNDFPDLPVREHERVFAWFASFPDRPGFDRATGKLHELDQLVSASLQQERAPDQRRLVPTPRSLLAGAGQPYAATDVVTTAHDAAPDKKED